MAFKRVAEITEPQAQVFKYIVKHVCEHGFQPSTTEMATHFGVSRRAIADRIKQLASKGYVHLTPLFQSRNLILTGVKYEAEYLDV